MVVGASVVTVEPELAAGSAEVVGAAVVVVVVVVGTGMSAVGRASTSEARKSGPVTTVISLTSESAISSGSAKRWRATSAACASMPGG